MNSGMLRRHPFLMGIAALVLSALLLIFTIGTQVSYADGDGEANDPELNGSSIAGSIRGDGADAR